MSVNSFAQWYRANEPKICLGLGITTMVGAGVLTGAQTVKATRVIDRIKQERQIDKMAPIDVFKEVWKYYIPPFLLLVAGGGLLIRGYLSSAAALESSLISYRYLKDGYELYKENVKEVVGEKKESEIRAKVADKRIEESSIPKDLEDGTFFMENNLIWCLDSYSGRYFKSNIDKLRAIEATLNQTLLLNDWVPLNELYYQLGLDSIKAGECTGWHIRDGAGSIKFYFDSRLVNGNPVLVLSYDVNPENY